MDVGKLLIGIGALLIVVGPLWILADRLGFGRLPGDIVYRGDRVTFYFPLVTSIILSVLLTLGLWLLRWWRG
jgi:hypothetical protein